MTIKGRQFRRITGRELDGPRRRTGVQSQLNKFQDGLRPIRNRVRGSATKTTTSTHTLLISQIDAVTFGF